MLFAEIGYSHKLFNINQKARQVGEERTRCQSRRGRRLGPVDSN